MCSTTYTTTPLQSIAVNNIIIDESVKSQTFNYTKAGILSTPVFFTPIQLMECIPTQGLWHAAVHSIIGLQSLVFAPLAKRNTA